MTFKDAKSAAWFWKLIGTFGRNELPFMMAMSAQGADLDRDDRLLMDWTSHMEGDVEE